MSGNKRYNGVQDIVRQVARETGQTKQMVRRIFGAIFDEITKQLHDGHNIEIKMFGRFKRFVHGPSGTPFVRFRSSVAFRRRIKQVKGPPTDDNIDGNTSVSGS